MISTRALPEYDDPPVVETVLSVRFREVIGLDTARILRFWSKHLATALPEVEERPPYEAPIERFGPGVETTSLTLRVGSGFPVPRFFFSSQNDLVQAQPDWFAYNWRKTPDRPEYARYEGGRAKFIKWLGNLETFIQTDVEGQFTPVQCEVTYVNHIPISPDDLRVGPLGNILKDVQPQHGSFLPVPESARFATSYLIHDRSGDEIVGRLHATIDTATSRETAEPLAILNLTARGQPLGGGIPGVLAFCDLGREWVVQGFTDITSVSMHEQWRRTQ